MGRPFWRSVNLTGNQTGVPGRAALQGFWRSVNLTGNQTRPLRPPDRRAFWRSVNLTGNQTPSWPAACLRGFGAVSI